MFISGDILLHFYKAKKTSKKLAFLILTFFFIIKQ